MRKAHFVLLLALVVYSLHSYSSENHWDAEPKVIKNGLNDNMIYDVFHDNAGFIWLSTDKGLSRYDGFRFRDYPLILSVDSFSVSLPKAVKRVQKATEDLFYTLLYQGGIMGFDKEKEAFLPLHFDHPFKLSDISDFCQRGADLYLATDHGLYKASAVYKRGDVFITCQLDTKPLLKGKVNHLCTDGKNNLYFSVDGKKIVQYDLIHKKTSLIKEGSGVGQLVLQQGYLWICRLWNDVVCYDLKRKRERVISIGITDGLDYSNSCITDLASKDKRTFYLTGEGGLFRLEFNADDLIESSYHVTMMTRPNGIYPADVENKMTSLSWDGKQGILWAGTLGGGVVKYDISENSYNWVLQHFDSGINGVVEDAKGYIWLAMTDGGVMKSTSPLLSRDMRFEQWKGEPPFCGSCRIYQDRSGNIWLGNNQGEVIFVNPITKNTEIIHLQINKNKEAPTAIHQFCIDAWDRLWVATSNGLIRMDTKTSEYQKIALPGGAQAAFAVTEDKEGNIWVGTDKGLKRLEVTDNQIQWKGNYEVENGLEETEVRSIYVNNYNQIYACYLNVVIRIDGRDKDKIETVYTLQKGLTSGHIICMVDDHIGNTWAGNTVGVMTVRNGQDTFYNYLSVGNCSAVCRLHDGRLLWASSRGLLYFDPSVTKKDAGKGRLKLTDVEVSGTTVMAGEKRNGQQILSVAPEKQEKLVFAPGNNDFHLYFSELHYGMMQHKIAYRLLPESEEWQMKPLADGLGFNRLPAGKYTLQVKLVFPDGREGEMSEIPIAVKAKWYGTIVAYLIYFLLVVSLSYLLYWGFKKRENLLMEKWKTVQKNEQDISLVDPEKTTKEEEQQQLSPVEVKAELMPEGVVKQQLIISGETHAETEDIPAGSKKTLLIVEDHKDIRLYMKVLFGKEYNLLMATNGQEGVDMALKELPDLIICDIMMPIKDGFECCREVKEAPETCGIPFIILTAKVEDDDVIRGLEVGADDYVLKPFTPGILKAKVRNLINGRQSLKQIYSKLFKLPGADLSSVTEESEKMEEEVKTEDPFITSVIKIVEANICEADFSVKKLASEMNMSQPTLYRKVKQSTDYTIIELIRGVRMRRAGELLKMKQYAVQDVAEMVGYNDIPTFRKHFVDAFGMTPSTYE